RESIAPGVPGRREARWLTPQRRDEDRKRQQVAQSPRLEAHSDEVERSDARRAEDDITGHALRADSPAPSPEGDHVDQPSPGDNAREKRDRRRAFAGIAQDPP